MISCDENNYGCQGGNSIVSYMYVYNNGIMSAADFPYKSGTWGDDGYCSYDESKVLFSISNAYAI